jgi:hypothetical protein
MRRVAHQPPHSQRAQSPTHHFPMMLTDAAALALLKRYCEPLRKAAWAHAGFERFSGWTDAALEHVDLVLRSDAVKTAAEARSNGARARLALGVAHAVSCCHGFDPAASGAPFWRRVVPALWSPIAQPNRLALSRATFQHVGLGWNSSSRVDDAYWMGFFHGTPALDAVLAAAVNRLGPHLEIESPLPPVHVALSRSHSFETTYHYRTHPPSFTHITAPGPTVAPHALRTILRAVLEETTPAWSARTQVGLVIDYGLDDDAAITHENLDLLARVQAAMLSPTPLRVQLTIDRLAIELSPPTPPHSAEPGAENTRALVTRGRALGTLLRTLLVGGGTPHVHTVALMGCSHTDFRLVGSALSAVAQATPPIVALRCSELFDATRQYQKPQRLAWLAYTLYCRRRLPPLSLSLLSGEVAMDESESDYINQLVARGTPLRDVVGEALRLRLGGDDNQVARLRVDCLRLGSTVQLRRGTRLYFEPFRANAQCVAVAVEDDNKELDLVTHVLDHGGFVGVVYAGYGLVWAMAATVVAWHRVDHDDGDVVMADSHDSSFPASLASLTLRFEGTFELLPPAVRPSALRVSAMLPLLAGATLEALTMDRAVVTEDDLALVVSTSPRLHRLSLDRCVVETLAPLVDAYQRRRTCIAVLSLLGVSDFRFRDRLVNRPSLVEQRFLGTTYMDAPAWMAPFVEALATGVAHGMLRELHVDIRAMPSTADERAVLERVAQAMAASSLALQRLHVTCRPGLEAACPAVFGLLRDAVLHDPPRVRRAILSVLRAWRCAYPEVANVVLAMAEGDVRTITWDSNMNL